jgi:rare lipoprotein A
MVRWSRTLPLAAALVAGRICCAAEAPHPPAEPVVEERGEASYYANKFQGRKTANGERFRQRGKTAASKTLPLGTKAKVTNAKTGKSTTVRINDRGPFVDGRVIDLSKGAAEEIGLKEDGVAPVVVEARPSAQPTPELKQKVEEHAVQQASGAAPPSGPARVQQAAVPEE